MKKKDFLIVSTSGSVDDGKSTLIGRLLYDSNYICKDTLKDMNSGSGAEDNFYENLARLTDGLESEREQNITIDVAYRHFSTPKRRFLLIDVPGHEQYTRNMVTGVSNADVLIILIDATLGFTTQSKRHFFIAHSLGIKNIVFAINKMDLVDYNLKKFTEIKEKITKYSEKIKADGVLFIPISAKYGDMVVDRHKNMSWYKGPTILGFLETINLINRDDFIDFRMPVQYVVKKNNFRGYTGRVESGVLKVGDEIFIRPSGLKTKVKDIYIGFEKVKKCFKNQSVLISVKDQVDISRGDVIVDLKDNIKKSKSLKLLLFFFSENLLSKDMSVILKNNTTETRAVVRSINGAINIENAVLNKKINKLKQNDVGYVVLDLNSELFFDLYSKNKKTGSCIIIDDITHNTIGAGLILDLETNVKKDIKKYLPR